MASRFPDRERGTSEEETGVSTAPVQGRAPRIAKAPASPSQKEIVAALIVRVNTIHAAGEGEITLSEIVSIAGLGEPPASLRKRGAIRLKKTSESGGTFSNSGAEITFEQELKGQDVEITIPRRLAGAYRVTPDSLHLEFQKGSQVVAEKTLFSKSIGTITVLAIHATTTTVTPVLKATGALELIEDFLSKPVSLK